ncbi:hypothetical protein JOD96_001285 [Flavobacterium sp. 1355]|nr:hypothetical protein [Flavobacterium sp. 1355]
MDIKKLYQRFFYLNTGPKNGSKPTTLLSCIEAFIILMFFIILKKTLFSSLKIDFPIVFVFFAAICLVIEYFNKNEFKRQYEYFTTQWKNETRKTQIKYIIYNVVFLISVFLFCLYTLSI